MSTDQKSLEVKVGLFVFLGLLTIAMMAVQFGRLGQGWGGEYPLTVEFHNAGGLVKDAQVQLSGAVIGHVAETPAIDLGHLGTIFVRVKIKDSVRLPVNSTFVIGMSGMLGDKFLQITPPDNFDPAKFNPADPAMIIPKGAQIKGDQDNKGLDALAAKGSENMDKLLENQELLKTTLTEISTNLPKILSAENIDNLKAAFVSVKTTADNFASASSKVDKVVMGAQNAVDSAKETMATARQTMTTANAAANDIRAAIGDVRGVAKSAQGVLKAAQSGPGTIPMLIGNREVADNLNALLFNIRRHGLLFYHDTAQADGAVPAGTPAAPKSQPR